MTENTSKTFGERLIEALDSREFTGVEQEGKVSRFFNVNIQTAREYLQAASCPPSLQSKFQSLADSLMMDATWLLAGKESKCICYPEAKNRLAKMYDGVTHEEIAAWIWLEGLDAYTSTDVLGCKFSFGYYPGALDYTALVSGVYFKGDDIDSFKPSVRYITGKALLNRWGDLDVPDLKAFIAKKASETNINTGNARLTCYHPTWGSLLAPYPDKDYPSLEDGLFARFEIERIEAEDFGVPVPSKLVAKNKIPPAFTAAIVVFLDEISKRMTARGMVLDRLKMLGTKENLREVAVKFNPEAFTKSPQTFDDYLVGSCKFMKQRPKYNAANPYIELFSELFK